MAFACNDYRGRRSSNYLWADKRTEQRLLALQPNQGKAAAFLETRRYGAYLGGTTEFNKWEGAFLSFSAFCITTPSLCADTLQR